MLLSWSYRVGCGLCLSCTVELTPSPPLYSIQDEDRKTRKRPPQKHFDREQIQAIGGEVRPESGYWVFEGNKYKNGFLYKSFPMMAVVGGVRVGVGMRGEGEGGGEG